MMKTNLFTTCRGILVVPTMDGLDCIGGKLITNFIGLMAALKIIRSGTKANGDTEDFLRIVGVSNDKKKKRKLE